jgi:hypothetical protein
MRKEQCKRFQRELEMHKDFRCYMGWREKPLGTGEAAVIVIPLEEDELNDQQLGRLLKIFKVTTFSEETIDFTIQELDWEFL